MSGEVCMLASFPGSPKARAEEEPGISSVRMGEFLLRFWVNRILSVHHPSPK